MSRDIVLACDDCQECLWVGERREHDIPLLYVHQCDAMTELATFLVRHHGHMLSSGGSHDYDGYAEIGWEVEFPTSEWVPPFWLCIALFCGCCVGMGLLLWDVAVALHLGAWIFGK